MSPVQGGHLDAAAPVVVRFRDDEIVEGFVSGLDLDRPEVRVRVPAGASNNREMIVPLSAVKLLVLRRSEFTIEPDGARLRKAVIRFWDGDVLKGYMPEDPHSHQHALRLPLVSPALDELEEFAIPYDAIKAIFFPTAWDSRAPVHERDDGRWAAARLDTPLLDLLGEIRGLSRLHLRGKITSTEFERRRRAVLDRL